jgi:hypothetical protein
MVSRSRRSSRTLWQDNGYRWFTSQHEDNPGRAKQWRAVIDHLLWNVIRPEAPEEYEPNPEADTSWEWAKEPEVREAVRPRIAELARVVSFLAAEGVSLLPDAHALFVDAVSDNLYLALELLERRAIGDHSPDETPLSFPAYTGRSQADDGMDPLQLWEAFVSSVDLAPTTVGRWRAATVLRFVKETQGPQQTQAQPHTTANYESTSWRMGPRVGSHRPRGQSAVRQSR